MVDCGNSRCFQERRSIRKELLSWSKKVPLVVGLETIAEHVGSRRKVRKLFEPFRCLESKEPTDWEPEENCIYCPDKTQLLIDAIEQTAKETSDEDKDGVTEDETQIYSETEGRDILGDIKTGQNEPQPPLSTQEPLLPTPKQHSDTNKVPIVDGDDSPVASTKLGYNVEDLCSAVNDIKNGKLGTKRPSSAQPGSTRSPIKNKVARLDGDVLSPGSPFRHEEESSNESVGPPNKELPFLSTRDRMLQLTDLLQLSSMQYLAPMSIPFLVKPDILAALDNLEVEKKLQQIRHKHNLSKAPNNHYKEKARKYPLRPFQKELIKKLTKERLELERQSESMKCDRFIDMKSLTHSVILSALEGNSSRTMQPSLRPHESAVDLYSNALNHSALISALTMKPLLSTRLSGMENPATSQPANIVVPAYNPAKSSSSSSSISVPNGGSPKKVDTSSSNDQKASPSQVLFKYENTRIGDTLKDIIVKTISEKVKCKLESTDFSGLVGGASTLESQKAKETILSAFSIPDTLAPPSKKVKHAPLDPTLSLKRSSATANGSNSSSSSGSNPGTQVKKTRPKRGQYRKYNSQLLTEAVKAVQRGEMSVHRAGSYYGVPHSTLEYKVKERHLLRQKKIKEQQERKMKEAEEAKKIDNEKTISPSKTSKPDKTKSDSSKLAAELLNISPPKSFPGPSWLPPFAGPSPFDSAAALGLFGSGFSLSTPASELLRKLQHKVQN